MKRIAIILAAVAVLAPLAAPSAGFARTLQLADLRREVSVSGPRFSPDGSQIAFVRSTKNFDKDRMDDQLMLLDVKTGRVRPLTFERDGIGNLRWSPSGDRLAFLANDSDQNSQIYVMPMSGGDARQVTTNDNGAQEFEWRPDGRALAFVAQDDPKDKDAIDQGHDAFEVGDQDYKSSGAALPSHLWLAYPDGHAARRLTKGDWSLASSDGGASFAISWSADGSEIAVTRLPNAVYGDSDPATVALVNAKTGSISDLPRQRKFLVNALFQPAGDTLAMNWFRHGTFNSNSSIVVASVRDMSERELAPGFDHNEGFDEWAPDGDALIVGAENGAHTELWRLGVDGSRQRADLGDVNFGGDADVSMSGAVAFIGDEAKHPAELYYLSSMSAGPRRLTDYNASISALSLGEEREVTWTGPGGYKEDGIITLPPSFSPHGKYPLVLVVHGGPQGSSQLSWDSLTQLLAARGFVAFQPNYRGSTNLGDAYQHAIYRDTGDGPGKDVMAGVAAVEKLGFIDSTRMAVSGWSYGGYMTTWLESHYDVWKVAMAGASLTDWVADYTIAWYQKGDADFFGPSPWTDAGWNIWRAQSPIAYVRDVKAPTLIMGDVGDANVPIYNSYQWYHGLKDNGVTVEFLTYPRNSHFPDDPVGVESVDKHWVEWIAKYLGQ